MVHAADTGKQVLKIQGWCAGGKILVQQVSRPSQAPTSKNSISTETFPFTQCCQNLLFLYLRTMLMISE